MWGGGGGGGRANGNAGNAAGGGGGGAYTKVVYGTVNVGDRITFTIGAGGAGGATNNAPGAAGISSTCNLNGGATYTASAGTGGFAGMNGSASGAGGTGGTASAVGGLVTASFAGGNGAAGSASAYGGGGGSSAGNAATGVNATNGTGAVAPVNGGNGGNGGATGAGSAGIVPGGGGGGAYRTTTSFSGGNGATGRVIITYNSPFYTYCPFDATTVEPITLVNFAGINQSSSNALTSPDFENICVTGNVVQGNTYAITVKGNTDGNYTDHVTAYFDWNRDGDYADAGESYYLGTITNSTGLDAVTLTGSITVPAVAGLGATRMRIVKNFNSAPVNACTAVAFGQAEEYGLNVTAPTPCAGAPVGGTASVSPGTGPVSNTVTLNASGATFGGGITYQWQTSTDGGTTWTNIAGATSNPATTTTPAFFAQIKYRLITTCTNSGLTATSTVANYNPVYCTPTHDFGFVNITKIKFAGTLNDVTNTSTFNTARYQDFTGLTNKARQAQGEGVNVDITNSTRTMIKAWIDWNRDGVFQNTTELVYSTGGVHTLTTTFGFQIPATAVPGDYRIRIRVYNYLDDFFATQSIDDMAPCNLLDNGETEDYLFTVIAKCDAKVLSVTLGEGCTSGLVSIPVTFTSTPGTTQYKIYATETATTQLTATPNSTWNTPSISSSTTYWVAAYNGTCESYERVPIKAVVKPVPTISFTPSVATVCGDGAVLNVQATGNNETAYLINNTFNDGTLGSFTRSITGSPAASLSSMQWQNKTSVYVITNTTVWRPAISSGIDANKFLYATSDFENANITTDLTTGNLNSTAYTNLTLEFDLYYSHYYEDNSEPTKDYLNVMYSVDGGTNWSVLNSYVADVGIGTRMVKQVYSLPASCLNINNLRIRFRYHGEWVDGVAIDDVMLYGNKPLTTSFSWSPTTGNNLYTDAAGTTLYTGGSVPQIYVKPIEAQMIAGNPLTFTATATLSNGCSASGNIVVNIEKTKWVGSVSNDWHNPANWCSNKVPTSAAMIEINTVPAGYFYPIITSDAFCRNITIATGASVGINATGSLDVKYDFVNNGTFDNNGTIKFTGPSGVTQQFPGPGTITNMNFIEINNVNGVALNKSIEVKGGIDPKAGALNISSYDVTLKSSASHTAYFGTKPAAFNIYYGSGKFIAERYIGVNQKKWQLLATPVTGQTIQQSWMEGGVNSNGYGTIISGTTGTGGGFDYTSPNPAMKIYQPATDTYTEVGNPTTTNLMQLKGYYLYVRGNRTIAPTTPGSTTANLRSRGTLLVGDVTSVVIPATKMSSVGNPYASAIDFTAFRADNTSLENGFTVWDPYMGGLYGQGAYVALSAANSFVATSSYTPLFSYTNSTTNKYIQSGQAFFMNNPGSSSATVLFKETHKSTTSKLVNRGEEGPADRMFFRVKLHNSSDRVVDGNATVFSSAYSLAINTDDMKKIVNPGENFSIARKSNLLAVEARNKVTGKDTVYFDLKGLSVQQYTFKFGPENMQGLPFNAELVDTYLNKRTQVSLANDTTEISFNITADAASKNPGRFYVVFTPNKNVKVTPSVALSVIRNPHANRNELSWTTEFPDQVNHYLIERSDNGTDFQVINTNNEPAAFIRDIDNKGFENMVYYRVTAESKDGEVLKSNVVPITDAVAETLISINPNPVKGSTINVHFTVVEKGNYEVNVLNAIGQVIYKSNENILHQKEIKQLKLKSATKGTYILNVSGPDGKKYSLTFVIE